MAQQYIMPISQVEWGTTYRQGNTAPLLHNSDSSYVHYDTGAGSIVVFPEIPEPTTPVIAVGLRYKQGNGGLFNMYNGWVEAQMLYDGVVEPASRSYVQDGTRPGVVRTILGPPVYRPGMEPWRAAEINLISASVGAAVGPIGPNKNNRWCQCHQVEMVLYTADPVPVPNSVSPANAATRTTSSVNFSAVLPSIQRAQPARAVFQVARDAEFLSDVRTFVGTLGAPTTAVGNYTSTYTSVPGEPSWTDLGPGVWHLRVKGRDFLGNESTWSGRTTFTINNAPLPTPTTPGLTGTVPGPYAIRGATFAAGSSFAGGVRVGVRWQFSQSSTFSSGVIEWLNLDGVFAPGTVSYDPEPASLDPGLNGYSVSYRDPSQYLAQGAWFARARAEDKYGQSGGWSTVTSFVVYHPPSAVPVAPVGGAHFDPDGGLLEWNLSDPWNGDRQSTYEVEVLDSSSNVVYASGLVRSSLTQAAIEVPSNRLNQTLSWRARLRDRDNVQGTWSSAQTFTYVRRPAVLITEPTDGGYVEAGQPLIQWDVVFHPGASQAGYRVTIIDSETRGTVYDSGYVIDNVARSHAMEGTYLDNMTTYEVTVRLTDSNALVGDHRVEFTTNFVLPPTIMATASPTPYEPEGYVRILWDGPVDPLFEGWRVYRRPAEGSDWTLVAEVPHASAREARDWTLAESGTYVYAVVQVASRHGSLVEGARTSSSAPIRVHCSSYWLVVPEMDFGLRIVPSGDNFSRERESSTMDIIGRGRKVNFGQSISREGSLTVPVRHLNRGMSASDLVDKIDLITLGVTGVYLRDPFGNYFPVALGRYSFDRMAGVGATEMGDLEVSYVEVFE